MDLPKHLKIGYRDYKLIEVDRDDLNGECNTNDGTIVISTHYDEPAALANTLLHEALHAIYFESGLWARGKERKKLKEEDIVRSMTDSLCAMFRDNPKQLVWMLQQLGVPVTMKRKKKDA